MEVAPRWNSLEKIRSNLPSEQIYGRTGRCPATRNRIRLRQALYK